ncbi:ERCC4 domain [Dillenia turbinata]|uniref:ERCC4 domain n=1 Tax=Dillenia turbinata TaxID=194707 RepID=A0AAN8Z898_9MAGN
MSQPIPVDIISDSDSDDPQTKQNANSSFLSALPLQSKKQETVTEPQPHPSIFILDDDPTPQKPRIHSTPDTPSFVPETPMSISLDSDVSLVKCTNASTSNDPKFNGISGVSLVQCTNASSSSDPKFDGIRGVICLESDNETEEEKRKENKNNPTFSRGSFNAMESKNDAICCLGTFNVARKSLEDVVMDSMSLETNDLQVEKHTMNEDVLPRKKRNALKQKRKDESKEVRKKRRTTEEEKLRKAARKAEEAKMKKLQREKKKWEKGKYALKSIVAEIDTKVVERGSIGGHLLTNFAEKGLTYRITRNPVQSSIVWSMSVPDDISELSLELREISYIVLVYEADEFCSLVMDESLMDHVSSIRNRYPSHTICYLTNRLMNYIQKREQRQYKSPEYNDGWKRPPVEEVLSLLTTHFIGVHSRQCIDEAELAEHVVGLTCSLASCQSRNKPTRLSVNANGFDRPKFNKEELVVLVAIPKVQPRFALAIWKRYPTMKSLLSVYMDPSKSVREKELFLKDLTVEGLIGGDRRLGEICSTRIYRILMAQSGSIKTNDIEDGADLFTC